ncbi:ABC transporter ATP-binding protein [Sporofaciens sp. JLR.KK001]|uniref:ABC transporter ATP-binding protein/permease n=1 Tax=Sporofaciens sp. JLR.KK001 TaxID=3112621 RepID=UPI002FF1BFA2
MKKYWKKNGFFLAVTLMAGILASVLASGIAILLQKVVDVAVTKQTEAFGKLFLFAVGYILVLCVMNYVSALMEKYLTEKMIKQYRRDIFKGIMDRRPIRYYRENTADYISALTNDMKLIEDNYIAALLNTFKLVVMFAVTLVILLILSPMVTAILILTFLLMFLLPATIGRCLEKRQDRVSAQMAAFTEKLKDILSGYEVLRSYDRIEAAKYRFQEENEEEIRVRFRAARLFALNEGLSDTLAVLSTITVIFVSAYLVLIGQITMGTLLALVQLSSSFMAPVMLLMQNVPRIQSMKAVIARLNSYAEDDPAVKPLPLELPSFEKGIELDGASFSYDGEQTVLADITMRIDKGGKYAVMGPSGCGKTTLIKLLLGYFEDYGGSIRYDGRELRALDMDKIAGIISVIHQNVYLFNLSVRENILLFEEFDEAALAEAVEKSGVSLFIDEKEGGLDHGAGENGALLSGGQRQRVALARALIRRAPFVILDEGTSALDRKTACEIESRLLEDEELTLLTITHNPDPQLMRRYDGIYRMNDGRLENCTKTFYTE